MKQLSVHAPRNSSSADASSPESAVVETARSWERKMYKTSLGGLEHETNLKTDMRSPPFVSDPGATEPA